MSTPASQLFAGIEGGATCSKLVIVNGNGEEMAECTSEGLNYHLIGVEETAARVAQWLLSVLTERCNGHALSALGMGFSGAKDGTPKNEEFVKVFESKYGHIAEKVFIVSDTLGTLKATLPNGGAVVISGTGSSCFLEIDGCFFRCGGNGHLIGDKGSAIWIALRAIEYVVNRRSGWELPPHSTALIRQLMHDYFQIEDDLEILDHLYKTFSKSKISGFCSELAKHPEDKLCAAIFNEAGYLLGRHVNVVLQNAEKQTNRRIPSLEVITIGSVFKSWPLLQYGFRRGVRGATNSVTLQHLAIYSVNGTVARGLAYMAARNAGCDFPYDYEAFKTLLCQYSLEDEQELQAQ